MKTEAPILARPRDAALARYTMTNPRIVGYALQCAGAAGRWLAVGNLTFITGLGKKQVLNAIKVLRERGVAVDVRKLHRREWEYQIREVN